MELEKIAYSEYCRKLMAMRATVVDITRAIVNKASTNPPPKGLKRKLFDGVYLEWNNGHELAVWSYGSGNGKVCMGPCYSTTEAYLLQAFLGKLILALRLHAAGIAPTELEPAHISTILIEKALGEYFEAADQLKKVGRRLAETLVRNDQGLPFCLTRGVQPGESYRILYLNDGSGGTCPEESKLIRLCGERATGDVDNYEFFLRILLTA
jgi:hypothetical protein